MMKMKTMKKKIVSCVIAALLILAAGVPAFAGGGQSQGAAAAPANYGARTTGKDYWLVKYAQPVTLHVVNGDQADINYSPGEDATNNGWTKGIKETLNVNLVTDWVSGAADYTVKMNLSIASRQLPDLFRVNAVQYMQLVEAGMAADITDYVENNLSDTIKDLMAYSPAVTESAKRNGRMYGVPVFGYGTLTSPSLLWIRRDWKLASGLPDPKTIADLENIMKAFQTAHPGSYGMGLNRGLDEVYRLGPAFNAYPNSWITGSDGSIVQGSIQNEMREVLRTFADWYQKGYLRKDFMSQDANAVGQDTITGKQGVQLFPQYWFIYGEDTVKNQGLEAYFESYELPSQNGSPVKYPIGFDNSDYLVINKDCKNIDAALKCISYYQYIIGQGDTGTDMTAYEAHNMWMLKTQDAASQERLYDQVRYALATGDTSGFTAAATAATYDNIRRWQTTKDTTGLAHFLQVADDKAAFVNTVRIFKEDRYVRSRLQGPLPEEAAAYGSTLNDALTEGFTKIIIGQEPLSYFDTLVRQWKANGGDISTAAVNKMYGGK
jgi:putative aldouronate transport system substrate-binding protein